jgi:hypothetical protein
MFAQTAELKDHRGKRGVFPRASSQRRIAGRKKLEMIEVCASEAEGAFVFSKSDPGVGTEFFGAFVTL